VIRRYAVLAILAGALALISLDNTIVNVALPSMQEALDAGTAEMQWIVDAYSVLFAGTLLLAGALSDRFGRRRALLIGLTIFASGSFAAGLVDSAGPLIACRAVMGIGGAFIMPSTLSILAQVFTDRRERAQAIGIWAAVAGAAVGLGPIVGGALLEVFDWRSIFWVNPPLAVVVIVFTLVFVPESKDPARPRLDVLGAVASSLGLVALVVTIIELPEQGLSVITAVGALVAVVSLVAFVLWERRVSHPLLPMDLFAQRLFVVSIVSVALVYFALMGVMFFLPQFVQLVQGFTPLQSGFAVLPGAAGLFIASLISPRLADRYGTRRIVVAGLVTVALGLVVATPLDVGSNYAHLGICLALMGLGLGLVLPQATNGVLASVPRERAGLGSAVNDGVGELGGSLGVAILGATLAVVYRNQIDADIAAAGDAISGIPEQVVDAVRESLASASLILRQLPPEAVEPVRVAADNAFVSGMDIALAVGAVIAAIGAVVAWRMFPARVERVEE
jgi:MFS transporter, DHA2 family, multidrug resistance protein